MDRDPNMTPVEYFGLFVRWVIVLLKGTGDKNLITFQEFKVNRKGFVDVFVGSIVLFVIVLLLFAFYSLIVHLDSYLPGADLAIAGIRVFSDCSLHVSHGAF